MILSAISASNDFPEIPGYSIIEQIYLGSRTAVYRGLQKTQNHPVVIKVLRNEHPSFGEIIQFRNQYAITKNLPMPGIIHPLSLEPLWNGYALVMEDWGGVALSKYLKQASLTLSEILTIALQLADILHDLSQHQVVHKDIKPANILIQPESKQVKLIDFSIASLLPKENQEIQSANILEGTLAYLAPEQTGRMNRGIDYRADFYALGVTLYQLLTGSLPFVSDDPLELVHCHIAKAAMPVDQVNPEVPVMVAAIVSKLMAKNAEDRYQSALGLKHDLEQCLTQWQTTGTIAEFELGQRDLSDRFLIPEKLYGRNQEVQTLLQAFDRVANGSSELMLVAGFSGIGKTAVVNEVHKPIVRQRGYFIKGKFDQFNRNIPLSAFVQALRDLMGQLLSESDTQLQQWRTQILQALGESGQVLVEVIPELEQVIGKQPTASELSGSAAQNRFNLLFQKFIEVFTTGDHPLVIFLDDLQWADLASLQLLKLLMNDQGYLLLLGAYRDHEVSPVHPFMMTVAELMKAGSIVNTITLKPLTFENTNHLVADTLNCSQELAQPLTKLIDRKTQGNPFFTTQFLKALYEDGYIHFDRVGGASQNENRHYWECDIAQVNALALTDDVVEFMALQLQKLPDETQQVLKLAACIGNQFDLATLAIVSEQSSIDTATTLWKALQEEFVLPTSQVYKFFQGEQTEAKTSANPSYRFLHDRVQQAAYSLIPQNRKQTTHYHIGKLLLQKISPEDWEERIFELVNQLNYGTAFISEPKERDRLAHLNLIACRKARSATAYQAGLEYARIGLLLLGENAWQQQYEMTLAFHDLAAEVAMLGGDFEAMEQFIAIVIEQARDLLEKVNVYRIRIQVKTSETKLDEVMEIGMDLLQQLGVPITESPTMADVQQSIQEIRELIGDQKVEDFADLPVMTDAKKIAIIKVAFSIMSAAYARGSILYPLLTTLVVKLSLQYGNIAISATSYACYSLVLSNIEKDIDFAAQFGQLALNLALKFDDKAIKPELFLLLGGFILHRKYHIKETLLFLKDGYTLGLEIGNLEYAGYDAQTFCRSSFYCGELLTNLEQNIRTYYHALVQLKQVGSANYCLLYWQVTLNLLGFAEHPTILSGSALQETEFMSLLRSTNNWHGLYMFNLYKLTLCFLFGEVDAANNHALECRNYFMAGASTVGEPVLYFYDSLVALADVNSPSEELSDIVQRVEQNQVQLQKYWADYAPINYQHKVDLVEAEKYRILGNNSQSIDLYDRAISGAKANGYIQEEALGNELAAKFYLDWGKEKVAAGYMQEAYYGYSRWGAKAKTDDLEQRYPSLLRPILENRQGFNLMETLATLSETIPKGIADPSFSIHASTQASRSSSSSSINATLDFAAILRASQSLSSTIQLDDLLRQLSQIILQNSGADRCALIMPNSEGEWEVQAFATPTDTQLCHAPLQDHPDVPTKLIYYVKNTQEVVIIDDCQTNLPVIGKYLTQHRPKSVLCLPILNQGNLIGILYLQNRLTSGVFTSDRILILTFLCTQAAISLENARLYSHTQKSQRQLTQLLNNLTGIVYSCANDENWTMKFISGGCLNLTGYPIEDFLNNHKISFTQLIHPDDVEMVDAAVQSAVKNHQPYQMIYRLRTKQGEEKWVWEQGQGVFDQEGEILGLEGFVTDINDRKQAELALKASQAELLALFTAMEDIILVIDSTGKYLKIAPCSTPLLYRPSTELLGKTIHEVLPVEFADFFLGYIHQALSTGKTTAVEYDLLIGEKTIWFDARIIPMENNTVLCMSRDISERKAAEALIQQKNQALEQALIQVQQSQAQVVQSEKMSALGNLVAGVAHEINNPIGFLKGSIGNAQDYVQDLLDYVALYQQHHPNAATPVQDKAEDIDLEFLSTDLPQLLDSMKGATDRITAISNSLRTFSRADTEYKVSANLHDGIDSTILILKYRLKANEYRPDIEVIQDYGYLPSIYCFPGQLNQVFMNILANAIDMFDEMAHTKSFAELKATPQQITIRTTIDANQVQIEIFDNGKGMTEEVKAQIFDHLFTTKGVGKGTGLGLAIAKQIVVDKHGGSLEVQSTLGEGTKFCIRLPIGG